VIVAIEGIDGAGKSVQANLLASRAMRAGYSVFSRDYPRYESFFGKKIGELLVNQSGGARSVDPYSMCLWYASDRHVDFVSHVSPRIENTDLVIFNRYTLSSQIFQSVRMGDDGIMEWIENLEHVQFNLPRPSLYIVIDCDPAISSMRNAAKSKRDYLEEGADVYESDVPLQENAARLYRKVAETREDIVLISAHEMTPNGRQLRTIDEVSDIIAEIINEKCGLKI
jgi:dTMP kinase